MNKRQVRLGYIDVPKDYIDLPKENRKVICDHLIDVLLTKIDKNLAPQYNRVNFLLEVLESSLETNIEEETYEVATVIRDCINRLNED
jgi:protein-arginine kinase activator protein McsA